MCPGPAQRPLLALAFVLALLALASPAQAAAPVATTAPTLSGEYRVGQVLGTSTGGWSPASPSLVTTWQRCDPDGASCQLIGAANGTKYTLVEDDLGSTVRSRVLATNADGTGLPAYSGASPVITVAQPPRNTSPPALSGDALEGSTLTVEDGTWAGPGPPKLTRKWQRCDVAGIVCHAIAGQSNATYKLVPADIGSTVRAEITGTSSDGVLKVATDVTAPVAGVAPANTLAPTLSGTARDGQILKIASNGTWSGTQPQTAKFRWERCSATGAAPCDPIPGATGQTYTLALDDVDRTVRGVVTMTNVTGSVSEPTAASAKVGPKVPPAVSTAPSITGTPRDGLTLTAKDGVWTGTAAVTTTRVWQRCDGAGAACEDLTATGTTYKAVTSDIGSTFRIRVLAKNPDGETPATSAATAPVDPAPPAATAPPVISGAYMDGQILSATAGTWTGTPWSAAEPLTHAYQWQSCFSGTCTDIANATESTYRLTVDELGATMKVVVTAAGPGGTATSTSAASGKITVGPPVSIDPPQISGTQARDGQVWTSDVGTWGGTKPQTYELQWQRCTGATCTPISGEIGAAYKMTAADVGKTIRLEVWAYNAQNRTKAVSAQSPAVAAARPELDGDVGVSGELRDGFTVTATGAWTGTAPIAFTYQWERCVVTCVPIAGATQQSYKLTSADVGARMRVTVGATNAGGGGGDDDSPPTATAVLAAAPVRTADPVVTGTAREGATMTTTLGAFTGTEPMDRTVQWQKCTNEGAGCVDIAGQTAATLVLTEDLVTAESLRGATVRSIVTATNAEGAASGTSAPSAVIALSAPVNTVVPAVSPNTGLRDGALLTVTSGGWSGSKPMDFTYRWQRCNPAGTTCADIAGATLSTYRAATTDVGFSLRAVVIATNGADSASKASLASGVVGTNPPTNSRIPVLAIDGGGAPLDGATVRVADSGDWDGVVPMTETYEWWRCRASDGENCTPIPGATASNYRLAPADVGLSVRGRVIRTSAGGSTGVLSAATAKVLAAPPVNQVPPQVIGGAAVGKTLTAEPGAWSGTPELNYSYQWWRCELDATGCVEITGATASTYRLTAADDGLSVKVAVHAWNGVGADDAESLTTSEIQDKPPAMSAAPGIQYTGLLAQGATLTGLPGVWGGAQPVDKTFQWRRCEIALTGCVDIAGATGPTYLLAKEDVGKRIILRVTATNVVDVATAQSDATPTVLPEPPSNTVLPTIGATGGMRDGAKLTANTGNWKGAAPITYAVTWLRCDADGLACVPLADATNLTYTLTSDDVDHRMRVRVKATNAATDVDAESVATVVVGPALPGSSARPSVLALDGKAAVGGRLRAVAGTWTGTNPMDFTLQWQRCLGTTTAACEDVAGASGSEYVLGPDDVGRRLRVVVSARNAAGTVRAESTPTEAVPAIAPDTAGTPVVVGGPAREGVTLSSDAGAWSGTAPITYGYQWERCKEAGSASCAKIAGATRVTYTLVSADVGAYIRISVTAVNAGGKATRNSVPTPAVAGIAPVNTVAPTATVKGGVKVGSTLTATNGTWAGTAPLKYEVRWQKCDARGISCADADGGNKAIYKLTADDVNGTLLARPMRAVVTATNVAGAGEAPSAILGTAVAGAGVGSAGDDATGSAAKRTKTAKKTAKAKISKQMAALKSVAQIKKLRFTSKGQFIVTLACAKKSRTQCGATGRLSTAGMNFDLSAGPIKKGRSKSVTWKLTAAQRSALRGRASVILRVRIAAPPTPNLAKLMKKKVGVPKNLRGKAKKTSKKKASKRKGSSKSKGSPKKGSTSKSGKTTAKSKGTTASKSA